jgi:hypothetical protein
MPYYIRVLSPNSDVVASSVLRKALADGGVRASISGDAEDGAWEELVVADPSGNNVCTIEHTEAEGAGREEIDEFLEEIADCQPASAAAWLARYLLTIRSIYAIQILAGTYKNDGWTIVGTLKDAIFGTAGGIMQADNEGFSNEDGYHILWQFDDDVTGDWWMAVMDNGRWRHFKMELGDHGQREAFFRGEVPNGVETVG